ncbi:ArsR/SmtB family transcription factor [Halobacteriaceae archaeon GCM10025711]
MNTNGSRETMLTETQVAQAAEDAFAVLGHETRLAILFALWEHRRSDKAIPQRPMTFTALRKRIGMTDGSQFNYHLKPLLDRYVHHSGDGYILRREGELVVSAILSGAFTDEVVFDAVPRDDPCPICGGQTIFECNTERTLGGFVVRCTECEGAFGGVGFDGALSLTDSLSPVGIRSRDPAEFYPALLVTIKHQIMSGVEGVCPDCNGPMSVTPRVCADHHSELGRRCESCDTIFEVMFRSVCDVCHLLISAPSDRHLLTEPRVLAFLDDHGYDPWVDWIRTELEVVDRQTVLSEDPFELEVVWEADGDRLVASLDGDGNVTGLETGAAANG